MTDTAAADKTETHANHPEEHGHAAPTVEYHFDHHDLEYFDSEDIQAGRAIGKLLASFFLYTVIAMSIAAYWTYSSL